MEQVRRALFDVLTAEQVAQLDAISAAIAGGAIAAGETSTCPLECDAEADEELSPHRRG